MPPVSALYNRGGWHLSFSQRGDAGAVVFFDLAIDDLLVKSGSQAVDEGVEVAG